jgi:hypothetical protein
MLLKSHIIFKVSLASNEVGTYVNRRIYESYMGKVEAINVTVVAGWRSKAKIHNMNKQ